MDKPLNPMDKQLIASRFAKARNTYTREARVQQQVAEKMMQLIKEPYTRFRRVVEFGCGTGSYSRILLHTLQPETLLLNDLCREMEECVKELCDGTTVQFVPGDAEAIDFPGETDLITSCSTLQWFNDPGAFFTRCHQALVADGLLAFSTFGTTNMHEIRQLTGHGLDYLSVEELQALLSPHFDILHAEEEVVTLPFPTPQAVLKHLKQTGVTGTEKRIWTRSRLQSFCKEYTTRFSDAAGNVNLTYHPIYIIARKKQNNGNKNIYFISGIDTDAGKSYCTAWYARELMQRDLRVITQKFIQTGNTGHSEDIDLHRRLTGTGYLPEDKEGLTMPEIFSYPCSPHLAARIDKRPIDFEKIERATRELSHRYDTVLVEGAGGLMVPLTEDFLTIDYIAEKQYPLIFVTSGKLGSINHTLLSFEAIKNRGIALDTVLYNLYPTVEDKTIQEDTMKYIKQYLSKHFPGTKFEVVPEIV